MFNHVFRNFGLPEEMVSNRGPQFISYVWKGLLLTYGSHGELALRLLSADKWPDWAKDPGARTLPPVILPWWPAQLEPLPPLGRVHTEFSPSRHHQIDSLQMRTRSPTPVLPVDRRALGGSRSGLLVPSERGWDSAHIHLQRAVRRHKTFADTCHSNTPTFQPGNKVWLSTRELRLCQPCRKLSPRYIGPFPIQRQINEVPYRLQLPPRYRIHPSFHVSHLKLFFSYAPGPAEPETPLPEILDQPSGTFWMCGDGVACSFVS